MTNCIYIYVCMYIYTNIYFVNVYFILIIIFYTCKHVFYLYINIWYQYETTYWFTRYTYYSFQSNHMRNVYKCPRLRKPTVRMIFFWAYNYKMKHKYRGHSETGFRAYASIQGVPIT